MAYVPVPKDLTKVKTKVMFNLTRRQLVCFTAGALVGVPLFLWLREPAGNSMAAMCMMLVMMPFFLLAMYEKHGQPLEKIVGNILKVAVIRPRQRPYRTNNFYAALERQANLDMPTSPPATPSSLTGTWMAAPTMWALWSAQTAAGSTPWRAILATPARSRVIPCPTSASRATA